VCRDPDDDVLLETALAGHASYIVSRDGDLTRDLDLHEAATRLGLTPVTVAQFLQLLA
jgi:predicted nucleic acid-binding protein